MKGKSHMLLGEYLAEQYLYHAPRRHVRAFMLGCIQPDRNPATYLKGSLHRQWLRGHNWGNAQKYIQKLCRRLERKEKLGLFSCYSLGKLVHYTADAFTYAHNQEFTDDLKHHNAYEHALQSYFFSHFKELTAAEFTTAGSAMDAIHTFHRNYIEGPFNIHTDSCYIVTVCCCILYTLLGHTG